MGVKRVRGTQPYRADEARLAVTARVPLVVFIVQVAVPAASYLRPAVQIAPAAGSVKSTNAAGSVRGCRPIGWPARRW